MADSQLDEFTIEKMHWKQWSSVLQIGQKNKLELEMVLSFRYPDTWEVRAFTFTPGFSCLKEVHPSICPDDDDKVMAFNDFHFDYKTAVDQKIQQRKAKSAQHKVRSFTYKRGFGLCTDASEFGPCTDASRVSFGPSLFSGLRA